MHPIEKAWNEGLGDVGFEELSGSGPHPFWPNSNAAEFLAASDWKERLPTEEERDSHHGLWVYEFSNGSGVTKVVIQHGSIRVSGEPGLRVRSRPITNDVERAVWPEVGP